MTLSNPRTDVLLTTTSDKMQQIACGERTYVVRKPPLAPSVQRIWFYIQAPVSYMAFICEIGPARPPEDGSGGVSYELRSVYRIREPVALRDMQLRYGVRGAPRGLMYVPEGMLRDISWGAQDRVLVRGEERLFGIWKSVSLPVPRIEDSIGRWEVPNQPETLAEMDTTNFTDVSNTRDVDMDVDLHVSLKRRRGEDDALLEPTLKKPRAF